MNSDTSTWHTAISAHPWRFVAVAFGVGAYLALAQSRNIIVRAVSGAVGAVAVAVARDAMNRQLAASARSWIDDRIRRHADSA